MWTAEDIAKERDFVFKVLYCLCHDKMLAEDLAQETVIRSMKFLKTFRGDSSLRSWMYKIAKNIWFSYIRDNQRYVDCELPVLGCTNDVMEELVEEEVAGMILEAMEKLSIKNREVFMAFLLEELPYKRISKRFRISLGSVGVDIMRSRNYIVDYCKRKYARDQENTFAFEGGKRN